MWLDNQFYLNHITVIFLFSVVVLGYWLIHRTGQVSFAQGGFLMIGAYTSAALMKHLDFNFWLAPPLAGVVAAVVALAIGIPTLRLRGAYFFLITFAFGEIVRHFYVNAWDPIFHGWLGFKNIPGPGTIEIPYLFTLVFDKTYVRGKFVVLLSGACFFYCHHADHAPDRPDPGGENHRRRAGCGGPVGSDRGTDSGAIGFSLSLFAAFFTGIAGGIYASYFTFIEPMSFMIHHSIEHLSFLIVGGLTSVWGPLLGTAVVATIGEAGAGYGLGEFMISGLLMMLTVLFFPAGIVGIPRAVKRFVDRRRGIIVEDEDAGATTA